MKTIRSVNVSHRTAQRDLERALRFLSTLGRAPEIRSLLAAGAGYHPEHHQEGWDLFSKAAGQAPLAPLAPVPELPQAAAIDRLDAWDGVTFQRARAVLKYRYPSQNAYLFHQLTAKRGAFAVASAKIFTDRYVALRDGSDENRMATRAEDRSAMELLASREIIDQKSLGEIRALIAAAQKIAPLPAPSPAPTRREMQEAADALHVWLLDWSTQARACIKRGDYLVRLGLATRRARRNKSKAEEGDESDPARVA